MNDKLKESLLICRLCAEIKSENTLISTIKNQKMYYDIIEKVYTYFSIKISETDTLSKAICVNCCNKVMNVYEFHEQILKAQTLLKSRINTTENDPIENIVEIKNKNENVNYENDISECESVENISKFSNDYEPPVNVRIFNYKSKKKKIHGTSTNCNSNDKNLNVKYNLDGYKWKCNKCANNEIFKNSEKLQLHFNDVHKCPVQYTCIECPKIFGDLAQLKLHVFEHEQLIRALKNVDKFVCNICQKQISCKKNLIEHRYIHLGVRRFLCNECGKSFVQRPHLKNHMAVHTDATPFYCEQCNKAFKTKNSLHIHTRSHIPKEIRYRYECDICQKKFITTTSLKYHQKIHSDTAEYTCEHCGKNFRLKGNLEEHILTHTDIKPFHCEQCPSAFRNIYRLRQHQITHTDLKPHECDTCEKKFRKKNELTIHKRIHSGELPFKCNYCDKRFRVKKFLKVHHRQHTGEKPYYCAECNHHFTNSSNYSKHMKGRHGVNIRKNPVSAV